MTTFNVRHLVQALYLGCNRLLYLRRASPLCSWHILLNTQQLRVSQVRIDSRQDRLYIELLTLIQLSTFHKHLRPPNAVHNLAVHHSRMDVLIVIAEILQRFILALMEHTAVSKEINRIVEPPDFSHDTLSDIQGQVDVQAQIFEQLRDPIVTRVCVSNRDDLT